MLAELIIRQVCQQQGERHFVTVNSGTVKTVTVRSVTVLSVIRAKGI